MDMLVATLDVMPFALQKIFALVAAVTLAAGGNLCWCTAGAAAPFPASVEAMGHGGDSAGRSAVSADVVPAPSRPGHHACCDGHDTEAAALPPAVGSPSRTSVPPPHDRPDGPASAHCEQCSAQSSPTPDAKSAVPPAMPSALAERGADRVAGLLVPAARPFLPRAADSPPARDGQTLLALGCSLLD